jgi:hypothetical protein
MSRSHTLLLATLLCFGGFMISKIAHGLVTSLDGVTEVERLPANPVRVPASMAPPKTCVILPPIASEAPQVSGEIGETSGEPKRSAKSAESSKRLCRPALKGPRLHLI